MALLLASGSAFAGTTRPPQVQDLLQTHCLECHSTAKQKGDLDLETSHLEKDPKVWENVLEQIALGEMPPKKERQFTPSEKALFTGWVRSSLDTLALQNAGDPGPVLLRRLSNREYTYSIQDLTGVRSLEPAREFPEDGAAGEGFTNTGAALVISPALITKYLDAAKDVAAHMVLLPDGIRFSPSTSRQDWTNETLERIRSIYKTYSGSAEGAATVQQGITLDLGNGAGRLRLGDYLDALQSRRSAEGLSPKYLGILRDVFTATDNDPILGPLRAKFQRGQLTADDITPWQHSLWRFTQVGHIGKKNGPKAWMEPNSPLTNRFESRTKLDSRKDTTLYLVASNAGDGNEEDQVIWENARLVTPGRADIPVASIAPLMSQLETLRARLIESSVDCLNAIAFGSVTAPAEHLVAWHDYLGHGPTKLEALLSKKMDGLPDYPAIKGWTGSADLRVLANPTDSTVLTPETLRPHSISVQPSPKQDAIIAWKSPLKGRFKIAGDITSAHPVCGKGITWSLQIRRGSNVEILAQGLSAGPQTVPFGPFENVPVDADQVVAIVISPRDGNAACSLTSVNLHVSEETRSWDLAQDVSSNILKANPNGPWHFLSQATNAVAATKLPAPIAHWRQFPTAENAAKVREHLQKDFPLTSPLLAGPISQFKAPAETAPIEGSAPSIVPIQIPAPLLASEAEFVVSGRLKPGSNGSVQLQVLTEKPGAIPPLIAGTTRSIQKAARWSDNNLLSSHTAPIVVNDGTAAHDRFERALGRFRDLFPAALCYTRIVPVDEVVTLTLYHREDAHLRRLMLDEATTRELDRLWDELLFVSEAPLKQVAVFEQLWQFATQDADPSAFEPMRQPIKEAADKFKESQRAARHAQTAALLSFAEKAWRRPLTDKEIETLRTFAPPILLARILTSPAFLYRSEKAPETTSPVNPHELATRLSYFLWSAPPDERLHSLARSGALSDPETLRAETRRMIRDERTRRLATEFGCQWLHVRDIGTLAEKSERHFPSFNALRESMQEEAVRFLTDAIQSNAPVISLLDADHTFLNEPLAAHYGISFKGEGWQRVDGLKNLGRGGILGLAAPLAKQSGASRTSPILRGNWVSEVLLGERLPRPPKDVPILPEEAPAGLTERQLIERHSSDERCAGCHRRIDPIGFALEGFDAIGRSRPRDTTTALADGTPINGLEGLRSYLAGKRRADFLRQFSRKLLGYALGRSVQLSDKPLIEKLINLPEPRITDLVEEIVLSPQFRNIRGITAQAQNAQ